MRAFAYGRVSTDEQSESGLGLDAQLASAHAAIGHRGWELAGDVIDAGVSGSVDPDRRSALGPALAALDAGDVDALVVARLDRITRSLRAWAEMVERSRRQGWAIVAVVESFDLSTDSGEMVAGMLAVIAQYERRMIGSRTRHAMAAARARGIRLGRPVEHSAAVRDLVVKMRDDGATLQQIADRLTSDGEATPRGGRWHPSTVRSILHSQCLDIEASKARERVAAESSRRFLT
jgi:DNA invertase Pin-like site-specific DNA recombinase